MDIAIKDNKQFISNIPHILVLAILYTNPTMYISNIDSLSDVQSNLF